MSSKSAVGNSSMAWWKGMGTVWLIWIQIPVWWVTSCVDSGGLLTCLSWLFLFWRVGVVLFYPCVFREWNEIICVKCSLIVTLEGIWICVWRKKGLSFRYRFSACLFTTVYLHTAHSTSGSYVQGPRPRTLFPSVNSPEGGDRECLIIMFVH